MIYSPHSLMTMTSVAFTRAMAVSPTRSPASYLSKQDDRLNLLSCHPGINCADYPLCLLKADCPTNCIDYYTSPLANDSAWRKPITFMRSIREPARFVVDRPLY